MSEIDISSRSYRRAQIGIAELKTAIRSLLAHSGAEGLRNVDIGRSLGIHTGHEGHRGHIPRSLLAVMEAEGVVEQDPETSRWHLSDHMPN